jgi:DNA polymerase-1
VRWCSTRRAATFREERYPAYKAQRPSMPAELRAQLADVDRVVHAFGLPSLRVSGYEADDVIATLTREALEAGHEVHIVSGDKDFAQLVGEHVRLVDTMRDVTYDAELVRKKWGVPPAQMRDYQALVGDKVDNVPGVPGIGAKTAVTLLERFGTLEGVLAGTAELKGKQRENLEEYADQARLSRELVTLDERAPLPLTLAETRLGEPDASVVNALFRDLEFFSLLGAEAPARVMPRAPRRWCWPRRPRRCSRSAAPLPRAARCSPSTPGPRRWPPNSMV